MCSQRLCRSFTLLIRSADSDMMVDKVATAVPKVASYSVESIDGTVRALTDLQLNTKEFPDKKVECEDLKEEAEKKYKLTIERRKFFFRHARDQNERSRVRDALKITPASPPQKKKSMLKAIPAVFICLMHRLNNIIRSTSSKCEKKEGKASTDVVHDYITSLHDYFDTWKQQLQMTAEKLNAAMSESGKAIKFCFEIENEAKRKKYVTGIVGVIVAVIAAGGGMALIVTLSAILLTFGIIAG